MDLGMGGWVALAVTGLLGTGVGGGFLGRYLGHRERQRRAELAAQATRDEKVDERMLAFTDELQAEVKRNTASNEKMRNRLDTANESITALHMQLAAERLEKANMERAALDREEAHRIAREALQQQHRAEQEQCNSRISALEIELGRLRQLLELAGITHKED